MLVGGCVGAGCRSCVVTGGGFVAVLVGGCVGAGCRSCVVAGGGVVGLVGCRVTVNGLGEVVKGSNLLR